MIHVTLPQTVNMYFSGSPPEWRMKAIQKLQYTFWTDPSVSNARLMRVYIDNLQTYKGLLAADIGVMIELVDRQSRENGLRAEYHVMLDKAKYVTANEDDKVVDEINLFAPEDAM